MPRGQLSRSKLLLGILPRGIPYFLARRRMRQAMSRATLTTSRRAATMGKNERKCIVSIGALFDSRGNRLGRAGAVAHRRIQAFLLRARPAAGRRCLQGEELSILLPRCNLRRRERRPHGSALDHFLFDPEIVWHCVLGILAGNPRSQIKSPK